MITEKTGPQGYEIGAMGSVPLLMIRGPASHERSEIPFTPNK